MNPIEHGSGPPRASLTRSLKATLLLGLLIPLMVFVPLRVWFDVEATQRHTEAAFDQELADKALALGNLIQSDSNGIRFELNIQTERMMRTDREGRTMFLILGPTGGRLYGDDPLGSPALALMSDEQRYVDARPGGGEPMRMVVLGVRCGVQLCQVRVAETLDSRRRLRAEALRRNVTFTLLTAVVLMAVVLITVQRALRPLRSINDQIAQRSLEDLRPLQPGRVPSEVRPLIGAIDELLGRVGAAAQQQRHFIADAAHQLRTPLTALRTETELALLETHPDSVHSLLQRLHRSARRSARLADQLLSLARTEAASVGTRPPIETFDLKAVAQDAVQDWVPRAVHAGVDLGFQLDNAKVRGQRHLVRELLANLIHNALEYVPQQAGDAARVTVRTAREGAKAVLEVEDNGPGIAADQRELVFERFYRQPGSAGAGSGLGLAIVRDIARAHGANVALCEGGDGAGLKVRVEFESAD
jgi:two-component system sensor histidine kinase TctE